MEQFVPPVHESAPAEPGDEELVRLAQTGDRAPLEQLVRRHQAEVSRLLWRFTLRRADLDDLVQDVFLRVVRALPDWRPDRPFLHWLRRITVNVGRDFCRRESVRRRWTQEPLADAEHAAPEAVEPAADPAQRAAANEAKLMLAQLSPDDRTLLTMHYLEGWEFARIGELLGWSAPVTKLRAFRARRRLRALLSPPTTS